MGAIAVERQSERLRIAIAGGYFRAGVPVEAAAAVAKVAAALGVAREIELPEAERARAAAYVITAAEGAALHLDRLRRRAADYDPAVRDRLIAGAMIPAAMVASAEQSPAPSSLFRRGKIHWLIPPAVQGSTPYLSRGPAVPKSPG
jgi:Asp-tRNA(Asn)/Glu-tRNA(Gln) amidotransferase A subunit family amidase